MRRFKADTGSTKVGGVVLALSQANHAAFDLAVSHLGLAQAGAADA